MSNSSLVSYTNLSPSKNSPRNHKIDTITIHCMAGQMTAKACADMFAIKVNATSSNYCVGSDGKIALSVPEADRSWCSSSGANDHRAITIEVASDKTHPYAVKDSVYAVMLNLITDVCKRNGIKKLVWSDSKDDRVNHKNGCNMTVHCDYANKACPGQYLLERMPAIAEEVNKRLGVLASSKTTTEKKTTTTETFRVRKTWKEASTQKGAFSVYANAKDCADKNPGYSVFNSAGKALYTSATETKKSNETIAKEVIAGKWGNGSERKRKLTQAGYDYSAIQKIVTKLLK